MAATVRTEGLDCPRLALPTDRLTPSTHVIAWDRMRQEANAKRKEGEGSHRGKGLFPLFRGRIGVGYRGKIESCSGGLPGVHRVKGAGQVGSLATVGLMQLWLLPFRFAFATPRRKRPGKRVRSFGFSLPCIY